jgi:hypothetical protein
MEDRMPQESRNRKFSRAALCAAVGIVLVIAGSTAVFAGDDDDEDLPDVKFFKSLLRGFGLRNGQEAGIEYVERPPLVVPPSRDLPVPAAQSSLAASNPAWPVDPDEQRRKAARKAKAERRPHSMNPADGQEGDALKPSELAAGKTDKPAMKTSEGAADEHSPEMTPSQLGYTGGLFSSILGIGKAVGLADKSETAKFVREPPRNVLTDPPAGYRTPSPVQPYGIDGKEANEKAMNKDRQTGDISKQ